MATNLPPGSAVVSGRMADQFQVSINAGSHVLTGDEPEDQGGAGTGPSPYDYLSAALGSCTVMTLNMYARRKQWPLESVEVSVRHGKIHARDCADCETRVGMIDRLERDITLNGELDEEQRQRLLEIANRCPVHRTLRGEIKIVSRLQG
jgi:putative redox protein